MRLKWIALCSLLGFVVVLDPTPTPAQFGKRGDFGGKGGDFGFGKSGRFGNGERGQFGSGGFNGGGFGGYGRGNFPTPSRYTLPPASPVDTPAVVYGVDNGTPNSTGSVTTATPSAYPAPQTQFGRGGFGGGGFGGGQFGSSQFGGGQFGGGGRGMGDPSERWDRIARGKDSINLNDPENSRIRGFMERMGTPIPASGILTKQDYIAESSKRMASFTGGMGGTPGAMPTTFSGSMGNGGQMTFGPSGGGDRGLERLREQDKDGDGRISMTEADDRLKPNFSRIDQNGDGQITLEEYRGYYAAQGGGGRDRNSAMASMSGSGGGNAWGSWGGGGNGWGNRQDPTKDAQDVKPVAIRYGHLPKGLPEWFEEYDTNQDGQVALHEWRKGGESVESFTSYDLNGDGLITADELLRHDRNQADAQRIASIMDGSGGSTRPSFAGPSGSRGPGGMRGFGMRGPRGASPGDAPAGGIALPGSSPDSAAVNTERGFGKGRKGDGEKSADVSEKPEKADRNEKGDRSDKSESAPGGNGRWGSGGKKSKG